MAKRVCIGALLLTLLASFMPAGATRPHCDGEGATISGQRGEIRGTDGPDVIAGSPGNDEIHAGKGRDRVCGGGGDDHIFGGDGRDRLFGEAGRDLLEDPYTVGNRLDGGDGRDTVSYALAGSGGVVVILRYPKGEVDNGCPRGQVCPAIWTPDQLRYIENAIGSPYSDTLSGGPGNSRLSGWGGRDEVRGGSEDDHLIGGGRDDRLWGGDGKDRAFGGRGTDRCSAEFTHESCERSRSGN